MVFTDWRIMAIFNTDCRIISKKIIDKRIMKA